MMGKEAASMSSSTSSISTPPPSIPKNYIEQLINSFDILCPLIPVFDNAPSSVMVLFTATIIDAIISFTSILSPTNSSFFILTLIPLYSFIILLNQSSSRNLRSQVSSIRFGIVSWWFTFLILSVFVSHFSHPNLEHTLTPTLQQNITRFQTALPSNCFNPKIIIEAYGAKEDQSSSRKHQRYLDSQKRLENAFTRLDTGLVIYTLNSTGLNDMDTFQFVVRCKHIPTLLKSGWYYYDKMSGGKLNDARENFGSCCADQPLM
jgi:hypothetical protein